MLLPKQIWKDISGYEGKYQVSNTGRVRSLNYKRTGKIKVMKLSTNKLGYKIIMLSKNGKCKTWQVHRLVAQAFLPNPNNYPIINHKDENPKNNTVWNLEWCSQEYNINYGTRNEKASNSMLGKHLTEEHKRKISEAKKGKNKGKHHTEETKRKIGEAIKGKNHPKAKPILMFTLDGVFIRRFDCVADANEYLGKDRVDGNIRKCARGKYKTAWGYKWKYEEVI